MPHGGHSKSPNSSSWSGAFGGPSTWAGSAPGTPCTGCCCCDTAADVEDVEAGTAGDADEPGGCVDWLPSVGDAGMVRVKYHALPSAAPRTTRMMMNGSMRFI